MSREEGLMEFLENEYGITVTEDEISVANYVNYTLETPVGRFLVVDEEEAMEYFMDDTEQLMEELGVHGTFGEQYADYVLEHFMETDKLEDWLSEDSKEYFYDIDNEKASYPYLGFETRLQEELYESEIGSSLYELTDGADEEELEELKEEVKEFLENFENKKDELIDSAVEKRMEEIMDDGVGEYMKFNFGNGWEKDFEKHGIISFDIKGICEWSVDLAGWGKYLSPYDGQEYEGGDYMVFIQDLDEREIESRKDLEQEME